MKANQKFANAEQAVSPVIAVILMVAITVVLAATVFVLLQNIGPGKTAARLGFTKDETGDRLSVTSIPSGSSPTWNRFSISAASCAGSGTPVINVGASSGAAAPNVVAATTGSAAIAISDAAATATVCGAAHSRTFTSTAAVKATDFLSFCVTGTSPTATQVKIQIVDNDAKEQIAEYTFDSLAVCA